MNRHVLSVQKLDGRRGVTNRTGTSEHRSALEAAEAETAGKKAGKAEEDRQAAGIVVKCDDWVNLETGQAR
jgi:hypothetical protein